MNAINVGIVKNVAKFFFKLKIEMKKFAVQDVDDSEFTSWRVIILGPIDATPADATAATIKEDIKGHSSDAAVASSNPPPGCPFHK